MKEITIEEWPKLDFLWRMFKGKALLYIGGTPGGVRKREGRLKKMKLLRRWMGRKRKVHKRKERDFSEGVKTC